MPRRRRTDKRRPATGLPVGALHYLATGDLLSQDDGEAAFGPEFCWLDAYDLGHDLAPYWVTHHDAIEGHARAIGRSAPWCLSQIDTTKETQL